MAGSPRHRALDPFLHRLWAQAAAPVLRLFSPRQEERLGQAAEGPAASPASRGKNCRTRRERMAAQTHRMDEALSRSRKRRADAETRGREGREEFRNDG